MAGLAKGSPLTGIDHDHCTRVSTIVQTGDDAGLVTGAFFGPAHESMGGVLVREDLSAGFGGTR